MYSTSSGEKIGFFSRNHETLPAAPAPIPTGGGGRSQMSATVFASTRVTPVCRARDRASKPRRARPHPATPTREFHSLSAPSLRGGDKDGEASEAATAATAPTAKKSGAKITWTRRDHVASTLLAVAVSGLVNAVPVPASWADDAGATATSDSETTEMVADGGAAASAMESPASSTVAAIDAVEAAVPLEIIGGNRPAIAHDDALPPELEIAGVKLIRYVDDASGYSVTVPEGWSRDQPMANTPEFHPKSEYGGRRFKVTVAPVGRVSGKSIALLADSELENIQNSGFESAEKYAATEASKFAPLEGTPAAKAAGISATTQILDARVSDDGMYYYYSFRSEGEFLFISSYGQFD